jgi:hypothetical protein
MPEMVLTDPKKGYMNREKPVKEREKSRNRY